MGERRVIPLAPEFDLLFPKTVKIVMPRVLDRRAEWGERLHKNLSLDITAASASGDLREELKRPLAGAEIRRGLGQPRQWRLVYAMQVDDRLTLDAYYRHPQFQCKIPKKTGSPS